MRRLKTVLDVRGFLWVLLASPGAVTLYRYTTDALTYGEVFTKAGTGRCAC
jgi:hypothetical protein